MSNTAVIVLDVQQALFATAPRPFEAELVIDKINQICAAARAANFPIIYFQTAVPGWLDVDSEAWQLHADLQPKANDHYWRKTKANAFQDTQLDQHLQKLHINQLILCGYSSEFCIDSTLRYATTLGYQIILPADAHTTHDKEHLSAEKIRQHHTLTLSRSPVVSAPSSAELIQQLQR